MSIHVPITENMVKAAARSVYGDRALPLSEETRLQMTRAIAAAFKTAEIRMDPPQPSDRVTVWLTGPDGPESVVCQVGGAAMPHGAHVGSIQVGRADG